MAAFNLVITDDGAALLAAIIAGGDVLTFTKMQSGSGVPPGAPSAQSALVTMKQEFDVATITLTGSTATVRADFTNSGLGAAYTWKELGVWAADTPGGGVDILFAYGYAGANNDYMPADGGSDVVTVIQKVGLAVGSANVTALYDESAAYTTLADITALLAALPKWFVDTVTFTGSTVTLPLTHTAIAGSALSVNIVGVGGGGSFSGDNVGFGVEGVAVSFDGGGVQITVSGNTVNLNAPDGTVNVQVMYQYVP